MKAMNFDQNVQPCGGMILEKPISLHTMLGLLSADKDDEPKVPKCGFTPL
ncbi:hypothetical protein ACFQRK_19300 [Parapedobacter sp. GCM10030251]|jgi:hypothetical protein